MPPPAPARPGKVGRKKRRRGGDDEDYYGGNRTLQKPAGRFRID